MPLSEQKCVPCHGGTEALGSSEAIQLHKEIPEWTLHDKSLERNFKFKDFHAAMRFVNRVADIANEQDHHPDLWISYSKVRIELSTHAIGGLSRNDFIMAARIDQLLEG